MLSFSSRIKLRCTFLFAIFKSHTVWKYAQRVDALTTVILPTTAGTFDGLDLFRLRDIWVTHSSLVRTKISQNISLTEGVK